MSSYLILLYGILPIFCVIRPIIRWTYALCSGDWAGAPGVWNATNQNGQTGGSCANRTGYLTCADFVRGQGAAFAEACEYIFRRLESIWAEPSVIQIGKLGV